MQVMVISDLHLGVPMWSYSATPTRSSTTRPTTSTKKNAISTAVPVLSLRHAVFYEELLHKRHPIGLDYYRFISSIGGVDKERATVLIPPLLKAYLKSGAAVLGEPIIDRHFRCADFLTILDMELLNRQVGEKFDAPATRSVSQAA